jgi:hypothetical protein
MVTEPMADGQEANRYRYSVRIMFKHPSMDLAHLTDALGVVPRRCLMAGAEHRTPNGDRSLGLHKESVWSDWFRVEGNRRFFADVDRVIDRLEPHKALLAKITDSGGSITLLLHLPGDENMGDVLGWRQLARLADLHVALSVEVFPEYN